MPTRIVNGGVESATQAAKILDTKPIIPPAEPGQKIDWNDWAQAKGEGWQEALKDELHSQIESDSVEESDTVDPTDSPEDDAGDEPEADPADEPNHQDKPYQIVRFRMGLRNGVHHVSQDEDGEKEYEFICSPLYIKANTRDVEGDSWGRLLEWKDPEGRPHKWAMPARLISGGGEEYRSQLLDGGLEIAPGTRARNHLTTYIQSERTEGLARCTERTGWHGEQYVFPHRVIGTGDEQVVYQTTGVKAACYGEKGTRADWRREVASRCVGHSRLAFAVSTAFAAPLLELVQEENGGVHLQGASSEGKSTTLYIAASVFGPKGYVSSWRATSNGLEAVAAAHSGALLILDEMGQVDPREVGEVAYMLAAGAGKTRANRTGGGRKPQSWALLFLSSGELDLTAHMQAAGKRAKAGQAIRLLSLSANPGKGYGVFDHLGGETTGAKLSAVLRKLSWKFFGTAGPAFIEAVSQKLAEIPEHWEAFKEAFLEAHLPPDPSGQVQRAAQRFALIGFGGTLATRYGITGWDEKEAENAAATCFESWLEGRGGSGNRESQNIVSQVRRFFEAHGESRFREWDNTCTACGGTGVKDYDNGQSYDCPRCKGSGTNDRPINNRAGARRMEDGAWTYYVLSETFWSEVC